ARAGEKTAVGAEDRLTAWRRVAAEGMHEKTDEGGTEDEHSAAVRAQPIVGFTKLSLPFAHLPLVPLRRILYLLLLVTPTLVFAATGDVAVRPAPAWAQRTEAAEGRVPREEVRWGIYGLLTDHQVRIS